MNRIEHPLRQGQGLRMALAFALIAFFGLSGLGVRTVHAQNVGIGTCAPDPSALLDLTSSDQGFLVPRMTKAQRDLIPAPKTGLLIFQTDSTDSQHPKTFYYYNGTTWVPLLSYFSGWSLTGNGGTNPPTNFLGTTDAKDMVIKTNSTDRIHILSTGFVGVNTAAPVDLLTVNNGDIEVSNTNGTSGKIEWQGTGSGKTSFIAGAQGNTSIFYTWPTAAPTANQVLTAGSGTPTSLVWANAAGGAGTGWLTTGNTGTTPGTNFLGTIDSEGLVVRTYNKERMRVLANGLVGIGTSTPDDLLTVNDGDIEISNDNGTAGKIELQGTSTGKSMFRSGAMASDVIYTLPTTAPLPNQVLTAGATTSTNLVWGNPAYCDVHTQSSFGGSNQNDVDLGTVTNTYYRCSSTGAINVTGFKATSAMDGREVIICNVGSNTITLTNDDANSTAGNRLYCKGGVHYGLAAHEATRFIYDNTSSHWQQVN